MSKMETGCSIRELFDREGTDKGRWYGGLYDVLLQPHRQSIACVVEIGIGTLIPGAASSMVGWGAKNYRPGASLRAWREFLPNAFVYGVDVAPDTQFADEARLKAFLCDSTDTEQVNRFFSRIAPAVPDLIVDDGLHEAKAQIKTLKNFLPFLRPGGLYVLEDVAPNDVSAILSKLSHTFPGYPHFVDRRSEPWVAIVIRRPVIPA
jgi:hypothetical protein